MTEMNRAYSLLTIKEIKEGGDERIIRGIATTPNPDRVGDIVEPLGVQFQNPTPLLFHHDSRAPIGLVVFEKPTKTGVAFEARIPKITEEGKLKERVDEAWQSVKAGLIRAVSIGFRSLETKLLDEGGLRFVKSEILELSLVVVPANRDATITSIKQFDTNRPAASGVKAISMDTTKGNLPSLPGVTGNEKSTKGHSAVKLENTKMTKSYAEQISAFTATLEAKNARIEAIMGEAAEAGETLDAAQEEEYNTLADEVKSVETHLARLENLQKSIKATAKPVNTENTVKGASENRGGATVKAAKNLDKGIEFARFAIALGAAKGNIPQAFEIAKQRFPDSEDIITSLKAAVSAGTTTDATWAAPLVDTYQRFAGDFVEFLRPQTIIGKFGTNGVPSLRRVPFNISVPTQTSGGSGYWVGEGAPKPLTKFDFAEINLRWAKVANIAVVTDELIRFSNPAAEGIVRDQLAAALVERLDIDFVDPAKAASANVSPASITNGVTPIASSGTDADAVRADVKAVFSAYLAANVNPTSGVWIMPSLVALSLSLMTNPLGQSEFPGITMTGGSFNGMPVIVSDYVPAGTVILANASDIYFADDGQVVVDASREASLQMDNAPTNHSGTPTPTTTVSMFQTNSVAIRAERWINWQKRRASAVAMLSGVFWGGPTGS